MTSYSQRSGYAQTNEELEPAEDELSSLAPVPRIPSGARSDIVFTFAFGTWGGAAVRNFSFPEDRFALALPGHARIGRVLICDHFRSAPRKFARTLLRRSEAEFPATDIAAQFSPLRLRREHPLSVNDVERVYAKYERGIRRAAARHGLNRPVIVTANPFLAGFGDFSWAGPVTFYSWDEFACSGAPPIADRWWSATMEAYRQIRAKRRRVVAVSSQIIDRIAPTGPHGVAPNAVDAAEWERLPPPPDWFAALPSPRILYVGGLQSRIDVEQIRHVAGEFAEGSVTLVGPLIEPKHFEPLQDVPNIRFYPPVPRTQVVGLIGYADVGLIPHIRNLGTEAMSPLKLYEYLAGGLPVAAVDLAGIVGISPRVALVSQGGDMAAAVRQALALGRDSEEARLAFVAQHTWNQRINLLLDIALSSD
jgi:teichuronic acid biosynthesis glycosyltransferase TuaH